MVIQHQSKSNLSLYWKSAKTNCVIGFLFDSNHCQLSYLGPWCHISVVDILFFIWLFVNACCCCWWWWCKRWWWAWLVRKFCRWLSPPPPPTFEFERTIFIWWRPLLFGCCSRLRWLLFISDIPVVLLVDPGWTLVETISTSWSSSTFWITYSNLISGWGIFVKFFGFQLVSRLWHNKFEATFKIFLHSISFDSICPYCTPFNWSTYIFVQEYGVGK